MVSYKNTSSPYYLCKDDGGERKWVLASAARKATNGKGCVLNSDGTLSGKPYTSNSSTTVYNYVCDADTFRTMTASETWALSNNSKGRDAELRCGSSDEGRRITLRVGGALDISSQFICKNKLYVWDGIQHMLSSQQIGKPSGYGHWIGGGVNIGTRLWMTGNLYVDTTGANAPYTQDPSQYTDDEIRKIGSYYTYEQASAACAAFGYSFRLPTPSEYKSLFNVFADRKYMGLLAPSGWNNPGSNDFLMNIYPNGQISNPWGEVTSLKGHIGYLNSNKQFVKTVYFSNYMNKYAMLHTSSKDSVVFMSPEEQPYMPVFKSAEYAGVRCVVNSYVTDPPTSN